MTTATLPPLSPRQERILRAIAAFWAKYRCSPSYRELVDACKLSSTSVATYNVRALIGCGLLDSMGFDIARSLRLTDAGLAWLGQDKCGQCGGTGVVERDGALPAKAEAQR